jgi:hypothetical protein
MRRMQEFRVERGTCRPVYVFEVGQAIDLDAAERVLQAGAERPALRHRERALSPFEFRPVPLRVAQETAGIANTPLRLAPGVEIVLYDFGAASVSYAVPLGPTATEMLDLSVLLRRHEPLLTDARRRVTELIFSLGSAVQRPFVAAPVEDYFIFEVTALDRPADSAIFCSDHAELLARVLRAETIELSAEEVSDAIEARISFGKGDVTLVDWDSAFILDPDPADLRAVLEFANVQLLELRYLDGQLDRVLERSYRLLAHRAGWRAIAPGFLEEDRRELSTLQVDSAMLLERVTNALKFLGEEYLARVYRLAAGRLHLGEWDAVITRKLVTIESIYQKITDRAAARRLELLEWIVIGLIALEVVLTLSR